MITENKYQEIANKYGIRVAAIKAVAEVESSGSGFLSTGEPVILFEPHVFWRELVAKGKNPHNYLEGNEDILYKSWGSRPYGKTSEQHSRLARAVKIDRDAALKSASWGKFQILGTNYRVSGFATLQDFINAMYSSEDMHLEAFGNFIYNKGLVKHLRIAPPNFARFAYGYNGSGYAKNKYDVKMLAAYKKYDK